MIAEQEVKARAYCGAIGRDPDEMVFGYAGGTLGPIAWTQRPRWTWYAVSPATAAYELALAAQRKEQDSL